VSAPAATFRFGHLLREVDYFAYPRTGSHFFHYCLSGLFDLVTSFQPYLKHPEVRDRQNELNPDVLYALSLREPGAAFQPLHINAPTGMHGLAEDSDGTVIVLIRDPIATAYSRYRVERDRWHGISQLTPEWLREELSRYCTFYDRSFEVLDRQGQSGLLVRWEDLVEGPAVLQQTAVFLDLVPKLSASFVWSMMRFRNVVGPSPRTFFRCGTNTAWTADPQWVETLGDLDSFSFERFGYQSADAYLSSNSSVEA
jgi:hypothetical protein